MATKKKTPREKKPKTSAAPKADKAAKATGKADTKVERFQQNMRCELTESDITEKARRVAHQLSEKALRVEAAKSATAHLKAEIKQIDSEISRLSQEINDGATYREVQCERHYIYRTGTIAEIRTDTSQKTFERPMTFAERQLDLIPKGAKSKGAKIPEETAAALAEAKETSGDDVPWDAPDQPGSDEAPESGESTDEDQDDDSDDGSAAAE